MIVLLLVLLLGIELERVKRPLSESGLHNIALPRFLHVPEITLKHQLSVKPKILLHTAGTV